MTSLPYKRGASRARRRRDQQEGGGGKGVGRERYKLLAVDLDGTLLDPSGVPHEADVRALRALMAQGIATTILTGRLYSGTRPAAERIGLVGPVGCVDGSQLVSTETHRTLFHHGLIGTHARALRRVLTDTAAATFLFAQDQVVHDDAGTPYLDYVSTWSTSVVHTERVVEHGHWETEEGVTAVVAVGTLAEIQCAAEGIARALGAAAQVATFPTRRLEATWGMLVRAAGGNKGSALKWLATHHGVTLEETVCVGDWVNDVPMFEAAGRSFAMGQAPDAVKSVATDVLDETAFDGGGIARAIEQAFGVRG